MSSEIVLVPRVLYKYYKPDSWKYLFEDWTIRFSPFTEFNDPFEAMPAFKKIFSEDKRKELQKMYPELKDGRLDSLECGNKIDELKCRIQNCYNIGVFCLTPTSNNILMWSHYTESHKGFVVGFDMESDFFKLGGKPRQWRPMKVRYLPERHVFDPIYLVCQKLKSKNFFTANGKNGDMKMSTGCFAVLMIVWRLVAKKVFIQ